MRLKIWIALLAFLLAGCSAAPLSPASPSATAPPPTATAVPTPLPDPQFVARAYLDAWMADDYLTMYAWLSPLSQEAVTLESFQALYEDIAGTMSLSSLNYEVMSTFAEGRSAQVVYRLNLQTVLVGEITRDTMMNLVLEEGIWRIRWDREMILPELKGGNLLYMEYRSPGRGNIYDRNGTALVAQADAVSIGLIAGETDPAQEEDLFFQLWVLTGIHPDDIREKLDASRDGWYVPLAEVAAAIIESQYQYLLNFDGLVLEPFRSRYYFASGLASQVIGYVSAIDPSEVDAYRRLGYQIDDRIGRMGLEEWGEPFLAGKHGGTLYVVTPEGQIVTQLAESQPEPAQSVYTTFEKKLQLQAQQSLQGFRGAIIVMERDTGRILAMASSPGFDPNLFEPTNYNSGFALSDLLTDPSTPFLNRATQGQYPLGSVFKIITMAAALEDGQYTDLSTLYCGHTFTEIPGLVRYDWTYTFGTLPSGTLTLPQGLMRSCNPWFWHIGLDFFRTGRELAIAEMAAGFGLGQPTGIEQVVEEAGYIPTPGSEGEAINLAIGQGDTLVTPLQVVRFIAAIGNGGDMLRPQVIERVEDAEGNPQFIFEPDVMGVLPISQNTLDITRFAMQMVVDHPRGTAHWQFLNFDIPVAGKTGTAEAPPGEPHAWFAGYTFTESPNRPDIAIVVVLEHAGEGSEVAAPVFRRMAEVYFFEQPLTALPWESSVPPQPLDVPAIP